MLHPARFFSFVAISCSLILVGFIRAPEPVGGSQAAPHYQGLVKAAYCSSVKGTTESLPCRTSGESANSLFALICARVTGLESALPALMVTSGFWGSVALTDTTEAVPTALFSSAVS